MCPYKASLPTIKEATFQISQNRWKNFLDLINYEQYEFSGLSQESVQGKYLTKTLEKIVR